MCELCGGSGACYVQLLNEESHYYDCPWCLEAECDDSVHDGAVA